MRERAHVALETEAGASTWLLLLGGANKWSRGETHKRARWGGLGHTTDPTRVWSVTLAGRCRWPGAADGLIHPTLGPSRRFLPPCHLLCIQLTLLKLHSPRLGRPMPRPWFTSLAEPK
jgi:hypothetical protein